MAIFSTGPIVGSISGNVGGVSFANSRRSRVIRKAKRASPTTKSRQLAQQSILKNAVARWQALDTDSRNAWKNAASHIPTPNRLGTSSPMSGYNYFLKLNLAFELDEPPVATSFVPAVEITFTSSVAIRLDIHFDGLPGGEAYAGFVFGRLLYRSTPIAHNNTWTRLGLVTTLGTIIVSIDAIWLTAFEFPILNQFVALEFRPFRESHFIGGNTRQILQTTA